MTGFELDMRKFANKVRGRGRLVMQKVSLEVDRGVVLSTPVDTGRARAGWNVGVNNVNLRERPGLTTSRGERAGSAGPVARQVLSENEATILREVQAGSTVFITNNVEYIGFLDGGSSTQAPQGMVAKTVARFGQIVSGAATASKREIP